MIKANRTKVVLSIKINYGNKDAGQLLNRKIIGTGAIGGIYMTDNFENNTGRNSELKSAGF